MHWRRKWQPTPVFLPGESQGRGAWWPSPRDLPDSGIEPDPALQADSLPSEPLGKPLSCVNVSITLLIINTFYMYLNF